MIVTPIFCKDIDIWLNTDKNARLSFSEVFILSSFEFTSGYVRVLFCLKELTRQNCLHKRQMKIHSFTDFIFYETIKP